MHVFGSLGRMILSATQAFADGLTAGFNGLNRVMAPLYDRFDAGFSKRTELLRARYAHQSPQDCSSSLSVTEEADRALSAANRNDQIKTEGVVVD